MSTYYTEKDYSILFVDDEEKTLKYFSRFFSKDYKVLTAQNTSEAKVILDQNAGEIGVLISDQRMPVEKGVELLKYSREKYPQIVRLLTTAYSDLGDAIEAVNRGEILRYIPKPWDISFLELEIKHAMRFFLLNTERELLRKEKLNVIQRVISINKAKDLIILGAGMTHVRYPVHAIRALLQQLPDGSMTTTDNYKYNDVWELIKSEIIETIALADEVLKDTSDTNNNIFESMNIVDALKTVIGTVPVKTNLHVNTGNTSIEANQALIEKLLQILLEQLSRQPDSDANEMDIYISSENNTLKIEMDSFLSNQSISISNIPAQIVSAFLICYHHGGNIQTGGNIIIQLPLTQSSAKLPELEQHWQEQIFDRYEVLPE